jgi:hypothetical protein
MKSPDSFLVLFGFNLRLLPRVIFPLLVMFSLNASIPGILAIIFRAKPWVGDVTGLITTLNTMPLMFCGLLGMQFLIRDTGWSGTASNWLMPAGEFLLTRPVQRRTAYLSRMALFFIVILLPCFLNVGVTMVKPDLRISLSNSKSQNVEVASKLTRYQEQFANSALIHPSKAGNDTLLIPRGAVLIALWQLWLATLLALGLQAATLLTLPSKTQIGLFMVLCFAPLLITTFPLLGDPTPFLEHVFFFFVHHGVLVFLSTIGGLALVQWLALNRVEELEVI